jgi:hypothetical protein
LEHFNDLRETERQLHFWKKACDDAHNLGAARLKVATTALQICHDEADHILGTDVRPIDQIAYENAKTIKSLVKTALKELE